MWTALGKQSHFQKRIAHQEAGVLVSKHKANSVCKQKPRLLPFYGGCSLLFQTHSLVS